MSDAPDHDAPSSDPASHWYSFIKTLRAKGRGVGLGILLPTIAALMITAGLGLALVFYLLAHKIPGQTLRQAVFSNHTLLVDEGVKILRNGQQEVNLTGLLITSLTAHIISWSQPLTMGLVAIRLAANWLKQQENLPDKDNLPTPEQYGLLFKLCSSASLTSIYSAAMYLCKGRRPTTPKLLIEALLLVLAVVTISMSIALTDTWLHAVTSAAIYKHVKYQPLSYLSTNQTIAFGTVFNASLCADNNDQKCGQGLPRNPKDKTGKAKHIFDVSALVVENRSSVHGVTTLKNHDNMAIISRSDFPENSVYTASTFGIAASCSLVKAGNCKHLKEGILIHDIANTQDHNLYNTTSISNSYTASVTLFYANQFKVDIPGEGGPRIIGVSPGGNDAIKSCVGPQGSHGYALLANCTMSVFDVVVGSKAHTCGSRTNFLVKRVPANSTTTIRLWTGIFYQSILSPLMTNTEPVVIPASNNKAVMAALSQEIARLTLASAGGILVSSPPLEAGTAISELVSSYPTVPLLAFLALLFVYALFVIVLFARAVTASSYPFTIRDDSDNTREVSLSRLLQLRLIDPFNVIAASFHNVEDRHAVDVDPSLETDSSKVFCESRTTDRLRANVLVNSTGNSYFSIQAGSTSIKHRLARSTSGKGETASLVNLASSGDYDFEEVEFDPYREMSNSDDMEERM